MRRSANFATGPGDPPVIVPKPKAEEAAAAEASAMSVSQAMMRRLDALEADFGAGATTYTGPVRWMIPYADLLTVLLGLFLLVIALYAHEKERADVVLEQSRQRLEAQGRALETEKARSAALRKRLAMVIGPVAAQEVGIFEGEAPASKRPPAQDVTPQLDARLKAIPDIEVERQARGVVVRLPDRLLFPSGSDALTPQARQTLDRLAPILRDSRAPLKIEGHTDNAPIATGRFPSNWELSTARATQIVRYLVAEQGFSPARLSASGYGEFHPIAANSSIEGKQKNRRVDIVVMNPDTARQEPPPARRASSGNINKAEGAAQTDALRDAPPLAE